MQHHVRLIAASLFLVCLLFQFSSASGDDLMNQRLSRWRAISLAETNRIADLTANSPLPLQPKSTASNFSDIKVNDDNTAATFEQRAVDLVRLPDNRLLLVWEDERNGDWDIYAQLSTVEGDFSDPNIRLIYDSEGHSQRQPVVAADNNGNVLIVWTEEESANLYARLYDASLSELSEKLQVNDNLGLNTTNLPAVAAISDGLFVIVWEDSRAGANIYGQLFDESDKLLGGNFVINADVPSAIRIAPDVCSNGDNFSVVWEDYRDGEGDVYFRIFNLSGVAISAELQPVDPAYGAAFQFSPTVSYLPESGYATAWISDRDGGQGVYAQVITSGGSVSGDNFQLNDLPDDICWDLNAASSPDSTAGFVWSNFRSTVIIEFQRVADSDSLMGSNIEVSDPAVTGERARPAVSFCESGFHIAWQDARAHQFDIYSQQLDDLDSKAGLNSKRNDDETGSQQIAVAIAPTLSGNVAVVWQDKQNDAGDIYLQRVAASGVLINQPLRLNDDQFIVSQLCPRIAASVVNGKMFAVWEDHRNDEGLTGKNIFAQKLDAVANREGDNLLVNEVTGGQKSEPDVALGDDGRAVVVWVDERSGKKEIYLQRYDGSGNTIAGNLAVSSIATAGENISPRTGVATDGSFVVSWTVTIGLRRAQYFQQFSADGSVVGDNRLITVDTSTTSINGADIFLNRLTGHFFIALIDSNAAGKNVKLHHYDETGSLIGFELTISEGSNLGFRDIAVTGDDDAGLLITWSDYRSGSRRVYMQFARQDNILLGGNIPVAGDQSASVQMQPLATINSGLFFCSWVDNRNPGCGFDIFVNSDFFNTTDAEDEYTILPTQFELEQNYPNPFNPQTVIFYTVRKAADVRLTVYNLLGQQVMTLVESYQLPGRYSVTWDGSDHDNRPVASGVYLYQLKAGDVTQARKMTLLK